MKINLIAAADENFLIGNSFDLPWRYKEDLQHFKKLTTRGEKNAVIMGKNTYLSLPPSGLPNRFMYILSSTLNIPADSTKKIISCVNEIEFEKYDNIFVIGGATVYNYFIEHYFEHIDTFFWTRIRKTFQGNVFFPKKNFSRFYIHSYKECPNVPELEFYELRPNFKKHCEYEYISLVQDIFSENVLLDDRTNVGTLSKFGCKMEFDLEKGFPLLTTKKMFFKGIVKELLWFLSGSTDATILQKQNVHIWDGNTTKENLEKLGFPNRRQGDGGPIYGFLMRHYGAEYKDCDTNYQQKGFDQIANVLHLLKTEPHSRRIVMNLWDPTKLNEMVLPPCHVLYQFQVRQDKLCCILYQRSGDVGLGVPFNIASASLLTHIFAKLCHYKIGTLTHCIGDAHIYQSHVDSLKKQVEKKPHMFPYLLIHDREQKDVIDFKHEDFVLKHYEHEETIKMNMIV